MRNTIFYLGFFLSVLSSCSNKNDFDQIVSAKWEKCKRNSNCIIDFSKAMPFDWDTMCFYGGGNSLDDIERDLGCKLKDYVDFGDRVIFLNKGKIMYHKYWFRDSEAPLEGTIFLRDSLILRFPKTDAKFKIMKSGNAFYIKHTPHISH